MKNVEEQNIKKYCNFYVSDIHLSVVLLPYINREIDNNVEVTTIFEKLNKGNFEEVIKKINVNNKEKILNINWICNYTKEEVNKKIKEIISCGKKHTIIIGGGEDFILSINKIINYEINNSKNNIKIIDCYNIEEIKSNMENIVHKYNGILNTINSLKNV